MTLHVGIIGAGALGRAYAAALHRAGCDISLVVREGSGEATFDAERVGLRSRHDRVTARTSTRTPNADVLLVAVRAENVASPMIEDLERTAAPVVIVTPMLSPHTETLWSQLSRRQFAMPSLVAERRGDDVRYLVPPLSATLLGKEAKHDDALRTLSKALRRGGVRTRFVSDVVATNRASTLAFFPLQQALATLPSFERWSSAPGFLECVAAAQRACRRFAKQLGPVDPGVRILAWALSSPVRLGLVARLGPRVSPFVAGFLEQHFGRKMVTQTALLAEGVRELMDARGMSTEQQVKVLPPPLQSKQLR